MGRNAKMSKGGPPPVSDGPGEPLLPSHLRTWLLALLLVASICAAYHRVWYAGFIWDDDIYVVRNQLLTAPDGLQRIWFSTDSPSQYFPLVYTTFRFERALWGLNPTGYHAVNVLFHTANALLLWWFLRRLKVPGAWVAAAIFALHPVQVESVAWITERKNVLTLFFSLLALLAWDQFVEARRNRVWRYYVLALLCYALALFSKTTACTLPVAMLLLLWLQRQPLGWRRCAQVGPFVLLGIGMGLLTVWWESHHQGIADKFAGIGPMERVLIASHAVWFYLGKLIWPANLTFSYPLWTLDAHDALSYGWLAAGAGACAVIALVRRFFGRGPEVAAVFFIVTLGPLLGFFMLATFKYSYVADHYQYVACIGPLALFAAGITKGFGLLGEARPYLKPLFCGVLLFVLGSLTWLQTWMYSDLEALWRTTIDRNPASHMAHTNLGLLLLHRGDSEEGWIHLQKSLELRPDLEVGHYNVGCQLAKEGQVDAAIPYYRKAIELSPNFFPAHLALGETMVRKGRLKTAVEEYEVALKLQPTNAPALFSLCWILGTSSDAAMRNGARAVEMGERAARLPDGQTPKVLGVLAAAYAEAGRFPDAIATAKRALDRAGNSKDVPFIEMLQNQVKLYGAGEPFRDSALTNSK